MEEEKNVEEVKEEVTETPVEQEQPVTQEEPKTEEVAPVPTGNNNKKGSKKVAFIIMGVIIVILLIVLLILLLGGNDKNKNNTKNDNNENGENTENVENTENTEIEPTPDVPEIDEKIEGADYTDLKVTNLNSKKTYEIQIAKKYEENHTQYEDGYKYGFYNKTTKKMITDIEYQNVTCGNNCSTDPNAIGCIETGAKVYSFNVNNTEYIYISYEKNVCGGIDSKYLIYNVNKDTIVKNDDGGRDNIEVINGEVVIKYGLAGNDVCGSIGIEQLLYCSGTNGYIFSKNGNFETIAGKAAFKYNNKFAILDYSKEVNPKRFKMNLYNEKGTILYSIDNGIAYNEKYVLTYNGSEFVVYDLNNNKKGVVSNLPYDESKYEYSPGLTEENGKLVIRYYIKNSDEPTQNVYFDL